ncbi:MAG: type II secretion system F family protein [Isosphaeraceae bacterium]
MAQELVGEQLRSRPKDPPAPSRQGGIRLQHMMFAVGVIAFICWLGYVAGPWLAVLAVFVLVGIAVSAVVVVVGRNAAERESMLTALAIAAERDMPLAPAADAFSGQYGVGFRWKVRLLTSLLSQGAPLPSALEQVPGVISPDGLLLVRSGWAAGTVARALRDAAEARARQQSIYGGVAARFGYVFALLFAGQVIVGFISYFIVPKFEAIFKDFGMPLPEVTITSIRITHWMIDLIFPIGLLVLIELVAISLIPLGWVQLHRWDFPLTDWILRRRHAALVLKALALTVEGGKTIESGMNVLVAHYPSRWVRRRLTPALAEVRRGGDWIESLEHYRLISEADAAVLNSASRVGNLSWALREVATASERRLGYRLRVLLEMLYPVLILLLGGLVGFLAVAYFLPLVELIERLSG